MVRASVECPGHIAGGFLQVPVADLMHAWRACRSRPLGIGDFRSWLACREMVARRSGLGLGRTPAYPHAELARLLGVTERRARASIRRLEEAGLLSWSLEGIAFHAAPGRAEGLEDTIGRGRGAVAVPRRMLRFLACGARPALVASALGVLLRCLTRRQKGFEGRGRIKASWIAAAFGVSARQVKAARAELVDLGWIAAEESGQWEMNRWGHAYRVDLGWSPPGHTPASGSDGATSSPPPADPGCGSSPPDLQTRTPSGREKDQDPAPGGPAGARPEGGRIGTPRPKSVPSSPGVRAHAAPVPVPPPRLDDMRPEDLGDVGRALALHGQAVARGLADPSEDGRLRFLALAEHARAVGTSNPPGLFAALVRAKRWSYATQADEDAARRRLREHEYGRPAGPTPPRSAPRPLAGPGPSPDARAVAEVRSRLIRLGRFADPWPAFRAATGWDRSRYDRALAELGLA